MAYRSEPDLVVLHAVRLKGFAEPAEVAEATGLDDGDASRRLAAFHHRDLVTRRDGRLSGYALLPAGRQRHAALLQEESAAAQCRAVVEAAYAAFLDCNETFKQIC